MSDPITNQRFASSLFAPALEILQRYNAGRLSMAESDRRRRQHIDDADRETTARVGLANLQRRTQLDVARETTDRTLGREDQRTREGIERERRKIYGDYVNLGGNKALTEFSAGDEGIAEIDREAAGLRLKSLRAQVKAGGQFVKQRAANLRALTDDTSSEGEATDFALNQLALQATSPNAAQAIADIKAGRVGVGLAKLVPEDRALFDAYKGQRLASLRVARYRDPAVQDALRGTRDAQAQLFALVQKAAPSLSEDEATRLFGLVPDVDAELGVRSAPIDFGKLFPKPATEPVEPAQKSSRVDPIEAGSEYGGLFGVAANVGTMPYRFGRAAGEWTTDNARYALPTLSYLAGGQKLLNQHQAAQEQALAPLGALRRKVQTTVTPLQKAGNSTLRALLRSVIRPQPQPATPNDEAEDPGVP